MRKYDLRGKKPYSEMKYLHLNLMKHNSNHLF